MSLKEGLVSAHLSGKEKVQGCDERHRLDYNLTCSLQPESVFGFHIPEETDCILSWKEEEASGGRTDCLLFCLVFNTTYESTSSSTAEEYSVDAWETEAERLLSLAPSESLSSWTTVVLWTMPFLPLGGDSFDCNWLYPSVDLGFSPFLPLFSLFRVALDLPDILACTDRWESEAVPPQSRPLEPEICSFCACTLHNLLLPLTLASSWLSAAYKA